MLLTYGYETVLPSWKVTQSVSNIYMRLYYIEGGDVIYHCKEVAHTLKKGFLYIFPTNVPYTIEHDPENPLRCLYLHIAIAPHSLTHLVEIDISKENILPHLINAFISICEHEKLEISGPLQQELSGCILTCLIKKNIFVNTDPRIARSIDYLLKHMEQNVTIQELSNISGYHPKYYHKLFTQQMGLTPHQFIIQYRMKQALSLLQDGNSIMQTALAVGYLDEKSFSRMFKKTYGILPSKTNKIYFSV